MKKLTYLPLLLAIAGCAPQMPAPVVRGADMALRRMESPVPVAAEVPAQTQVIHASQILEEPVAARVPAQTQVAAQPSVARENVAAVEPAAGEPAPERKVVLHTVEASETLYKIARQYQASPREIIAMNGLKDSTDIQVGKVLKVPENSRASSTALDDVRRMLSEVPTRAQIEATEATVAPVAVTAPEPAASAVATIEPAAGEPPVAEHKPVSAGHVVMVDHKVEPKETIYRISLKYNASVLDIMAANDFEKPQDLKAGTVVRVPVKQDSNQQVILADAATKAEVTQKPVENTVEPAAGSDAKAETVVAVLTKPVGAQDPRETGVLVGQSSDEKRAAVKEIVEGPSANIPEKAKPLSTVTEVKAEMKRGEIDPVASRAKGLVWPVKGKIVRRFGDDGDGVAHTGINIEVPEGTSVLASEGGTVLYASDGLKIYGQLVLLRHDNGMVSAYAHNSHLLVKKGERVKKGQVIAVSGATGNVETPQLHFELRQHASAVDPLRMLPKL